MNINGICYIAKKYQQQEKDFERSQPNAYGKVWAKGKICWTDNAKDSKDGSIVKTYTTKSFICFDPTTIDTIDACKNDLLIIDGQLKGETYVDKNGEKKKIEKIIINKASRYLKDNNTPQPQKEEIKEDASVVEELDDDIPF